MSIQKSEYPRPDKKQNFELDLQLSLLPLPIQLEPAVVGKPTLGEGGLGSSYSFSVLFLHLILLPIFWYLLRSLTLSAFRQREGVAEVDRKVIS